MQHLLPTLFIMQQGHLAEGHDELQQRLLIPGMLLNTSSRDRSLKDN
jgi:hypothetical protein